MLSVCHKADIYRIPIYAPVTLLTVLYLNLLSPIDRFFSTIHLGSERSSRCSALKAPCMATVVAIRALSG